MYNYKPPPRKHKAPESSVLLLWLFNFVLPGLGNLIGMGPRHFRQGMKMFLIGLLGLFFFHNPFAWLCLAVGLSVVGVVQLSTARENENLEEYHGLTARKPKESKHMDSLGKDLTVSRYASRNFEEKIAKAGEKLGTRSKETSFQTRETQTKSSAGKEDSGVAFGTDSVIATGAAPTAGHNSAASEYAAGMAQTALEIKDNAFDKIEKYSVQSFVSGIDQSAASGGVGQTDQNNQEGYCRRCNAPRGSFMFCQSCGHSYGFE